jgi:hypothetical protein
MKFRLRGRNYKRSDSNQFRIFSASSFIHVSGSRPTGNNRAGPPVRHRVTAFAVPQRHPVARFPACLSWIGRGLMPGLTRSFLKYRPRFSIAKLSGFAVPGEEGAPRAAR